MWKKCWRKESKIVNIWDTFWWLTVIWIDENVKHWFICKCRCWVQKTVNKYQLLRWVKTCWCRWYYTKNSRYVLDGTFNPNWNKVDKRFHNIYLWIIRRCWKKWPYEDVVNEWNSFEEFYKDMYWKYIKHIDEYWLKQTTIDRINPYWNYNNDNCRRATYSEQLANRRNLDHYIIWGKKYRLSELKEITWLTEWKIINRYKRYIEWKYTEEKMLFKWKLKWNKYCKKTFI